MKPYVFLLSLLCTFGINTATAQTLSIASGTSLFISANTIFHTEGLTLTPSSSFTLSGVNSITKNTTLSSPPGPTYVSRVYLFGAVTNNYSGTVQINYSDGELNGLTESALQVNNYTGSTWANHSSTTNDATNNYVLSSALSNVPLKEISLAASSAPLPVTWLSFTATPVGNQAHIQWSTAQETNSDFFEVQHSLNGIDFISINIQAAAGQSQSIKNYSFVHTQPAFGTNFYRIKQSDYDGTKSYTEIKSLDFKNDKNTVILGNPVGNILSLQLDRPSEIQIYSMDGKLVLEKKCEQGIQHTDISHLIKGIYLVRTHNQALRFSHL